jgi:hypothetical protein
VRPLPTVQWSCGVWTTARSIQKARHPPLAAAALALACCVTAAVAKADEPPLPPPRPPEFAAPAEAPLKPQSEPPSEGAPSTCLAKLIASGASAEASPAPAASVEGCGIDAPIRLSSITVEGDVASLPDRPLLACDFATVLADYVRLIVAPLGEAMLHAKVAGIETGPGYACRTQDRIAGAKISAHGHGLAVDFIAITLADKRRVLIERQTGADEASYFRAIRTAACGWFTTVLGPGSDSFHANNMHLDIEQHGSSGSYRICE